MKCDSYCNMILKTFAPKNSLFCTYCMFTDLKNASEGRPEKLCTLISANKMIISYITIHPSPRAMHQNADQCVQHRDQICKYNYCGNLIAQMTVYFTFYSITKYHAIKSLHVENFFLWHCVQVPQVEFSDESWFLDGLD